MTNEEMRVVADHYPQRGDQVELWLKHFLETQVSGEDEAGPVEVLLEQYQRGADERMSLEELVNGRHELPQRGEPKPTRKKLKRPLSPVFEDHDRGEF